MNLSVSIHSLFFNKQPVNKQIGLNDRIVKQLSGLGCADLSNHKKLKETNKIFVCFLFIYSANKCVLHLHLQRIRFFIRTNFIRTNPPIIAYVLYGRPLVKCNSLFVSLIIDVWQTHYKKRHPRLISQAIRNVNQNYSSCA